MKLLIGAKHHRCINCLKYYIRVFPRSRAIASRGLPSFNVVTG